MALKSVSAEISRPLDSPAEVAPVGVLAKSTEVHRITADSGMSHVELSGIQCVPGEKEAVNQTRFSRAVSAENQSQRAQRKRLRFTKCLEIAQGNGLQAGAINFHHLALHFLFKHFGGARIKAARRHFCRRDA